MYRFQEFLKKRLLAEGADIFDPKRQPAPKTPYDPRMDQSPEDDDYDPAYTHPDDGADPDPDDSSHLYPGFGKTGKPPYAQIGHTQGRLRPGADRHELPHGFQPHDPSGNQADRPEYENMVAGDIYHDLQAKNLMGKSLSPEEKGMLNLFRTASIKHGRGWKKMTLGELS